VALLSFGGPAGQIAVMHRILVEERGWISEERFLHGLNVCMLLPGPEAQQLATYLGWVLHRQIGGLVAGLLFILPGFLSILALSFLYLTFQGLPAVDGALFGLKAAILAVVLQGVIRIGGRALRNTALIGIAGAAFVAIFFLRVPFPWIIFAAALLGWWVAPGGAGAREGAGALDGRGTPDDLPESEDTRQLPTIRATLRTFALWLGIWWVPVLLLLALLGAGHVLVREALFFSRVALVTFGGAYAVLAYVAQEAVEVQRWLLPGEMLDGLGLAETTPGPLIQVVQFVGFLGAAREAGNLHPLLAGTFGALVTTWVTFAPCFLFIFVGAPYMDALRGVAALHRALTGITAAVVGVVLNLAIWFSLHVLFTEVEDRSLGVLRLYLPAWESFQPGAALIAGGAFLAIFVRRWGLMTTLAGAVLAGLALTLLSGWRG